MARAQAEGLVALAQRSSVQALIAHLKIEIAELNRDRLGPRFKRAARLPNLLATILFDKLLAPATRSANRALRSGGVHGRHA